MTSTKKMDAVQVAVVREAVERRAGRARVTGNGRMPWCKNGSTGGGGREGEGDLVGECRHGGGYGRGRLSSPAAGRAVIYRALSSPTAPRFRGRMSADTRARTRQRHRLQVAAEQTPVGLEQAAVMHAQVMVKGSTSGKSGQRHTRLR
jgi:hypothetical protein